MLVTTHALVGAAVGTRVRSPWAAALAGAASHLALDTLPHWGGLLHRDTDPAERRLFLRVAAIDGLAMLGVLAVLARHRPRLLVGAVGAVLPDLDKPAAEVGLPLWGEAFDGFHAGIQRLEGRGRWPVDLAVGAAAGLLVRARAG